MKKPFALLLTLFLMLTLLTACAPEMPLDSDSDSGSAPREESGTPPQEEKPTPTQEIVYVTDLHYNVKNLGNAACLNMNGLTADMRAQYMVDCMKAKFDEMRAENSAAELFVFITGDLCSTEYNYRIFDPDNAKYTNDRTYDLNKDGRVDLDDFFFSEWDPIRTLKTKYLDQLTDYGIYVYCTPGNHDAYQIDQWNELFQYQYYSIPNLIYYNRKSAEYAVHINDDTAVVMLNSFNVNRGAMEIDRNPNDDKDETYINGKQQTLGYTSFDLDAARAIMDNLVADGYKNVYIASHEMGKGDATLNALCQEYDCIKALVKGDWHQDGIIRNFIGDKTLLVVGHFSGSGMTRPDNPKFDIDIKTLPHSYVTQKDGLFTYYKAENAYFGVDNKTFMEAYFTLTKIEGATKLDDVMGENIVGLTDYTTKMNASNTEIDVSPLYFYRYTLRTDLTPEDRAVGERIQYFLDTYNIGVHLIYGSVTGGSGACYDYSSLSYQRYYLDESFYQPLTAYKTHKISE